MGYQERQVYVMYSKLGKTCKNTLNTTIQITKSTCC